MAKITKKILDKRTEIVDNGIKPGDVGAGIAEDFGHQASEAIVHGKTSDAWRLYMKNFASNKDQLLRLLGRDDDFNKNDWSNRVLAYITSNPICTTTTITGKNVVDTVEGPNVWTMNYMRPEMVEALENNIDNATGPDGWFEAFVAEEEKNG